MDTSNRAGVERGPRRKRRTAEEKRRMVQETFEPGASVARVAQRHAINANQLFLWRKLYREGLLGENSNSLRLLPVSVSEEAVSPAARASGELPPSVSSGTIYVELPKGYLRITGRPDVSSLRVLLECLLK
ncbi:MAG TPA: transposase [Candidatus Acidoferrum sp.]|nr:transposase [Candidatus Acidoferrum sp.]